MADIDYGLAWDFIDDRDGRPLQLCFRRNYAPKGSPETFDGTGQLIGVVAAEGRADNGDIVAISRPGVTRTAIDTALDGWQYWAMLTDDTVNLAEIRRRIHAADLT
jgi:hypothetical protein